VKRLVTLCATGLGLGGMLLWSAVEGSPTKINGWVLDSACAITKGLKKPISADCAVACAKAGSPLVVMDDKGIIYLPITDSMPATSQNEKLLPFAGQRVTVNGKLFNHNGTKGLVISDIQAEAANSK
jgi:hypothetical protein